MTCNAVSASFLFHYVLFQGPAHNVRNALTAVQPAAPKFSIQDRKFRKLYGEDEHKGNRCPSAHAYFPALGPVKHQQPRATFGTAKRPSVDSWIPSCTGGFRP